jgi:hypothetical protein
MRMAWIMDIIGALSATLFRMTMARRGLLAIAAAEKGAALSGQGNRVSSWGRRLDNIRPHAVHYTFFITLTFNLKWALRPAFFFHNSHL